MEYIGLIRLISPVFFAGVGLFCPDGGVHCAEPILWAGKKDEKDIKDKKDWVSLA